MKYMMTYDLMESVRNTNQWLGASARALASYPMMSLTANPMMDWVQAWGMVTERTFARMVVKPDWNIPTVSTEDGKDHVVQINVVVKRPFGDLIHFKVPGRKPKARRVLLVAPMSGHYATLLRKTVVSLLPDCEVFITDWHNARDIPVSAGKFDVEDYTLYLVDFMKALGDDLHVIAVCQPAPLTLAAVAYLAEEDPAAQPRSMTLIGGPIDPEANHTEVTDFGRSVTMGQLEETMIQRVGFKYGGVGRLVYPGLLQLASFISMNGETHTNAFRDQIISTAKGESSDYDKHNMFYDEYLAVMDMTAEFYLSTVERVFKNRDIARNDFVVAGRKVDIGKITTVAVKVVEGENDDISAPGQCLAALPLLTGLPESKKAAHLEPGAGHYGIFAGGKWRRNIRPLVLKFIDDNSADPKAAASKPAANKAEAVPSAPEKTNAAAVVTAKVVAPKAAAKAKASAPSKAKAAKPAPVAAQTTETPVVAAPVVDLAKTEPSPPATAQAPKAETQNPDPVAAQTTETPVVAAPVVEGPKSEPTPPATAQAPQAETPRPNGPKLVSNNDKKAAG